VNSNDSLVVTASINSSILTAGEHFANIYIDSNDPDTPTVSIPVAVTVINIPVPSLSSPVNSSQTTDLTPAFDWSDVAAADSYTILADNNLDFNSPEIDQSTTVSNFTPAANLAAGTYFWKARANIGEVSGEYSSAWSVMLRIIPGVPSNITTSVVTGNVYINWDDCADATSYDIYSCNTPYGTYSLLTNVSVSEYTYTPTASKMFFYIVAKNSTKESPAVIKVNNYIAD
jgi:hypothetical protein